MKTLVVECRFVIEVPWDEKWGDDTWAKDRIEEGCPGTGPVDGVLQPFIDAAAEASTCWACDLRGTNKLLEVREGEPVDYLARVQDAVQGMRRLAGDKKI